jgi:hypothetical protein
MRIRSALAVFLISVTTLGLVTPLAQADSEPTARELLEKCNNGSDSCVFHPSSRKEFGGRRQQVGRTVYNCSTVNQLETISWSEYTGGSNSLGISITATAKFSEVYSVAVTATYNVSWEWGHTVTRSDGLTTPPWGRWQDLPCAVDADCHRRLRNPLRKEVPRPLLLVCPQLLRNHADEQRWLSHLLHPRYDQR